MKTIQQVTEQILLCERCPLSKRCTCPVPLSGLTTTSVLPVSKLSTEKQDTTAPTPRPTEPFVVLGEAPGRIEDHKGVPFVGPAGQLLRRELAQMGIEDRAVFMNTVSCWPVGEEDTKPTKEQLQACRVNLRDQLDAVDAVYVLACGRVAIEALVPHATSHTRGHLIHIHDQMVFPVYHPSFILHKKSQEIYREWQEELRAFLFLMEFGQLEDTKATCIYCKAEKYGELDSCYKHRHDLQVDSIWSQTKKHYRKKKGEQVKGQTDLL